MRVGIVTFHRAMNYGAVLQAFALNKYINDEVCDCEVIDYIPNNHIGKKRPFFMRLLSKIKRLLLSSSNKEPSKYLKFNNFIKENMKLSSKKYLGDNDIVTNPPKYDIYISGSDQILNTTLTGDSTAFYLSFAKDGKKISYASSFGRSEISQTEICFINEYIATFSAISVREESARQNIKNHIEKDSTLVVDPVFLLDDIVWSECFTEVKMPLHYILVYAMEYSIAMKEAIKQMQKEYNIPLFIISGNPESSSFEGQYLDNLGPGEFLYVLKNADFVVTNSFHGTAFSIIFKKKFYCVSHTTRNTRIENLLSLVNQNDKLISHESRIEDVKNNLINAEECCGEMKTFVDISKQFIGSNLR